MQTYIQALSFNDVVYLPEVKFTTSIITAPVAHRNCSDNYDNSVWYIPSGLNDNVRLLSACCFHNLDLLR
jgi:hypothetical protein